MLTGLKNIAVEASFDTTLKGPLTGLDTRLALAGTGGSVNGQLTLDTKVPGWHGAGAVDVPVLAIGGVDAERARACREAGAAGFAAIGYFKQR